MKIELSHVTDFEYATDIHLHVSTKDNDDYFEKLFGLSDENGRYLVAHAMLDKMEDGSYEAAAFIEGTIYDRDGEVTKVPNRVFHDDDIDEINDWIEVHKEEWISELKKETKSNSVDSLIAEASEKKLEIFKGRTQHETVKSGDFGRE